MDSYKEIRIIYASSKTLIHQLKQDFIKFGVPPTAEGLASENVPLVISGNLFKQYVPTSKLFPSMSIYFYSDVYELAKALPNVDADLIILDEREGIENNDEQQNEINSENVLLVVPKNSEEKEIEIMKFENLKSAIEKFTPRHFHYSMRRILVVLPHDERKTEREFILSIEQVRGVIVEPSSMVDLFFYASKGLLKFYQNHAKTSLCISGGGVEGYLYALGVVHALDNCFANGKKCVDFDIFCGVSSGSIIASSIVTNISAEELIEQLNHQGKRLEHMTINVLFDFATTEVIRKVFSVLKAFSSHDLGEAIVRFQNAIPVGLFRGERFKQFLERQLAHLGTENKISSLNKDLYIGVTDLDTGENIVLGEEPWRDIKISQAVRASMGIPPFYLPEKINGHWFSDGQITGGAGYDHAIKKGAGLVVNIDPIVAYTSNMPGAVMKRGGYFTLLQAVKGLIQTRASSLLKHSMDKNPDVDFISFHPTDDVMEAMAGNPMKYQFRTEIIDLGFKCTIAQILEAYDAIGHKFAKHGFILKSRSELKILH